MFLEKVGEKQEKFNEIFFDQSGLFLGFECNFLFFANALFWASGDNLGLKFPANSCKRVAFTAGVQKKLKRSRTLKSSRRTLNVIRIITHFEMVLL